MLEVTDEEFRLIVSQWREKQSYITVLALYADGRDRTFTCVVQDVTDLNVVLLTEDGWLTIRPFGHAAFRYDTPPANRNVAKTTNSAIKIDWNKPGLGAEQDIWYMFESKSGMPGGAVVTTPDSN